MDIMKRLREVPGKVGFYYKNLVTGETMGLNEDEPFQAASVIKLPIYAAIMKLANEGRADLSEKLVCRHEDKVPPCGALYFFTNEPEVDIRTLCGLMITISDNAATNLLIRRFGIEALNEQFREIGLIKSHIERLLFDHSESARGKCNKVVPREMAGLLEKIARHTFVSEETSIAMEKLLLEQQINHKIPGYLNWEIEVGHKTGEDEGVTNDVGIVYAKEPFVVSFMNNNTYVPEAERAIREISLDLVERQKRA